MQIKKFQYISCCCLSTMSQNFHFANSISIHLMLLFIFTRRTRKHIITSISIHLMLLFIHLSAKSHIISADFNTSHVVVYLIVLNIIFLCFRFQYISCCCLSIFLQYCLSPKLHFNTSHVVVYRRRAD